MGFWICALSLLECGSIKSWRRERKTHMLLKNGLVSAFLYLRPG